MERALMEAGGRLKIPTTYYESGLAWVAASYVNTQNTDSVPVVEAPPAPPPVSTTPPAPTGTGCLLVSQTPVDGTVFAGGSSFSTAWVLQNAESTEWVSSDVDIRYVGAATDIPLHTGSDSYDLAANVQPGDTFNFTVPMISPVDPGSYGEVWEVAMGTQVKCQFYVYITVQ